MQTTAVKNIVAIPSNYLIANAFNTTMLSEVNLLSILFPGYWDNLNFMKYSDEETTKAMKNWCRQNNFYYYAKPKDEYDEFQAAQEAMLGYYDGVVVENMS
jgi:uncharacterized membrane protein